MMVLEFRDFNVATYSELSFTGAGSAVIIPTWAGGICGAAEALGLPAASLLPQPISTSAKLRVDSRKIILFIQF
jgi:hypothetical protein